MELSQARKIADDLVKVLAPTCKRIEIAGSIRREKADVGDIEIVAAPILTPPRPEFGQRTVFKTPLDKAIFSLRLDLLLEKVKDGDKYKQFWVLKRGGTRLIKLDLFLVTPPAQWGVIDLIRTGPADFSHWMVTPKARGGALPDDFIVDRGGAWKIENGMQAEYGPRPMPEETDFFTLCGMEWIEPKAREARWGSR